MEYAKEIIDATKGFAVVETEGEYNATKEDMGTMYELDNSTIVVTSKYVVTASGVACDGKPSKVTVK